MRRHAHVLRAGVIYRSGTARRLHAFWNGQRARGTLKAAHQMRHGIRPVSEGLSGHRAQCYLQYQRLGIFFFFFFFFLNIFRFLETFINGLRLKNALHSNGILLLCTNLYSNGNV